MLAVSFTTSAWKGNENGNEGDSNGGKRRAIFAPSFPWEFTSAAIGKMAPETAFVSCFHGLDTGNGKRAKAKGNKNGNEGKITISGGRGFYSDSASLISS